MPRKNTRQPDLPRTLYHAYNRRRGRGAMFHDIEDRRYFIDCLKRHLSASPGVDSRGRPRRNLRPAVRLVAFALMDNHFHLVAYQFERGGVGALTRSVIVAYTAYYNRKYGSTGALFRDRTRRRPLVGRREKLDAIAYVHDNHGPDCCCEFCSHRLYRADPGDVPSWVAVKSALRLFGGRAGYDHFRALRWQRKAFDREPPF